MTIDDTLSALEAIKPVPATAYEVGIHPGKLQTLTFRGLLDASRFNHRHPTIYSLSPRGAALIELMNAPVTVVPLDGKVKRIQAAVASHYALPLSEMVSARRAREVARPRQVAMYLARELTPLSLTNIGRRFGGRDHTTVIHAIKAVEERVKSDPMTAADVETLRGSLEG